MAEFVIPSVFKAVDKFSGTVDKMEKSTKRFAEKAEKQLAKVERKFRAIGNEAMKIGRQSAIVGAAIIAPMVLFANEAVQFEKSMSNISTLVDTNVESMEDMSNKVLQLAENLPVPVEELTSSLYDIRSAGISAENAMSVLETSAKLSAAGLSTVSESTNILTSALNAFKGENLSAAQTADILFKAVKFGKTTISELAQQFGASAPIMESAGVSLAEFAAATSALTTSGLPAAQAQNQLKAAIANLKKPTKEMQQIFDALGVTTDRELIQKSGGLVEAFAAVQQKSGELNINMAKAFGSVEALAGVTALLGANNQAYVTTLDAMVNGQEALTAAFDKQNSTAAAQMQIAKNTIKSISIQLGTVLLPIIADLLKSILPVVKRFGAWVKNNKNLVSSIAKVALVVAGLAFGISGISFAVAGFTKLIGLATFGLKIAKGAVVLFTGAFKILNVVMSLSPIFLIAGVVAAVGYAIYKLTTKTKELTAAQRLNNEINSRALENTIDQRVEVGILFTKLRSLEAGTQAYNDVLAKVEAMQPGITEQFNLQKGAIEDLAAAEKKLTENILERARAQAKQEILADKMRELVELQMAGPEQASTLGVFSQKQLDMMFASKQLELQADINALTSSVAADELGNPTIDPLNPQSASNQQIQTEQIEKIKQAIVFDFVNLPPWLKVATGVNTVQNQGGGSITPQTTETN